MKTVRGSLWAVAAKKIMIYLFEAILFIFMLIWIDHCQCDGRVTRSIKTTFTGQEYK